MWPRTAAVGQTFLLCFFCLPWYGESFSNGAGNGTSSEENASQDQQAFRKCMGLDGELGLCKYFSKCFGDEYGSDFALAINHSCVIEQTYVGICCAKQRSKVGGKSYIDEGSFAETLPLIAISKEEKEKEMVPGNGGKIVWIEGESELTTNGPRKPERSRGCGTTWKSRGKLVGGRPADPTEWPWMAALLRKDQIQYCGGVLITDRHVLTAAHCVFRFKPRDIKVRLGEYDFESSEESRSLDFAVSEILIHRDFDYSTYENDIAIVKMHRPTIFDSYIWPVCLPPIDQTFENKNAVVTGWGTKYYGGPISTVLMEVGVPIWPQNKCAQSFVQRIPDTAICAGAYEGGRDACQGDSGGPLLHQLGNGRWVNIGIVSWGIRCGEPGRPGIYTRVSSYLEWIFENAVL
ncbi:Proclotting enzyme [Anthophora quadrimaculata]